MPHTARKRRKLETGDAAAASPKADSPRIAAPAQATAAEPRAPHADRIRIFHTLTKQLAREPDPIERSRLQAELDKLGGLATYQQSSLHGADRQRGGADTARWLVDALTELGVHEPIRMLDVGAIDGKAYARWEQRLHVTSIDLHPAAFRVLRLDLLECVSQRCGRD